MSLQNFYDVYRNAGESKPIAPFWTVALNDDDEVLKWFTNTIKELSPAQERLAQSIRRNRKFYAAIQSITQSGDHITRDRDGIATEDHSVRVTSNNCHELVEQWVEMTTNAEETFEVLPNNHDEYEDRASARVCSSWAEHLSRVNDLNSLSDRGARSNFIDGEVYAKVDYDHTVGDLTPQSAEIEALSDGPITPRVPLLGKDGKPVKGEDGAPLMVDARQRVGEVRIRLRAAHDMWMLDAEQWSDVDWTIEHSAVHIDELRGDYPGVADEIQAEEESGWYSRTGYVDVWELYHRHTRFLSRGRHVKVAGGVVLENRDLPFSHGELPYARLTNIEHPGVLRGVSFLRNILTLQAMYNNVLSLALTNLALGAHLYLLIPATSATEVSEFQTGMSAINYLGGVPPSIQTYRTVGAEVFQMLGFLREEMRSLGAIQPTSEGTPPSQVEAGVAMAILQDEQRRRAGLGARKHTGFLEKVMTLGVATCGDYYDANDGRTLRVSGKNSAFVLKAAEGAKMGGAYSVRLKRSSPLGKSRAGALAQIQLLNQIAPGLLPTPQILDAIGLGSEEKYRDLATIAVQAAEYEEEQILDGVYGSEPKPYEDHIAHLGSHYKRVQAPQFKEATPEPLQNALLGHIATHERLAFEAAARNPNFAALLGQLPQFPMVFVLPPPMLTDPGVTSPPAPAQKLPPEEENPVGEAAAPVATLA